MPDNRDQVVEARRLAVTLREVTATNLRGIESLRVADDQRAWVATNAQSLLQARYGLGPELAHLTLTALAIYAGEEPVGLTLTNHDPERRRFAIMRIMVDHRHQGRGYGRAALEQLLAGFLAIPQATEATIGYQSGNDVAAHLYRAFGFIDVGADGDEHQMWRALNPQREPWESIWRPGYRSDPASGTFVGDPPTDIP